MRDQERDRRKPEIRGLFRLGGDYIFLLDDDDQFLADRFHCSLSLLRSGQYDAVLERTLRVYADEAGLPYETGPASNHCRRLYLFDHWR